MRTRFRILVVWMMAAFVVAGAAIGFAASGSNHGADVSAVAKATHAPGDKGEAVSAVAETETEESEETTSESEGERKLNHGFYVSAAAHCEDVDDPETAESPDFEAPEDCEDSGSAHGKYVSSVAKSPVGKPDKGKPED